MRERCHTPPTYVGMRSLTHSLCCVACRSHPPVASSGAVVASAEPERLNVARFACMHRCAYAWARECLRMCVRVFSRARACAHGRIHMFAREHVHSCGSGGGFCGSGRRLVVMAPCYRCRRRHENAYRRSPPQTGSGGRWRQRMPQAVKNSWWAWTAVMDRMS